MRAYSCFHRLRRFFVSCIVSTWIRYGPRFRVREVLLLSPSSPPSLPRGTIQQTKRSLWSPSKFLSNQLRRQVLGVLLISTALRKKGQERRRLEDLGGPKRAGRDGCSQLHRRQSQPVMAKPLVESKEDHRDGCKSKRGASLPESWRRGSMS